MDFLSRGYSALKGDLGTPQSPTDTINKLCTRLESAALLEDRRAAVLGLKGLSRQYKLEVSGAMDGLMMMLERDRGDVELTRAALEMLNILCTKDRNDDPVDLALLNTDRFLAGETNVASLLNGLEDNDFYIRFNSLQCLSTFQQHRAQQLQDRVLQSGLGVARLMDLLDDRREIIRNEALLLLIAITEHNAEIQKIVAFENAFDRLFQVVAEEGGPLSGGIVAQDCLQLVQNLLRYNSSNQNFFRETGGIQNAATLLESPSDTRPWSDQAAVNFVILIELLRVLVAPDGSNSAVVANQKVMGSCLLPQLLKIALPNSTEMVPNIVCAQALYAVGDIIRKNKANQLIMHGYRGDVTQNDAGRTGFDLAVEQSVLSASSPTTVRVAAAYVCESYLLDNPTEQLALAKNLAAAVSADSNSSRVAGTILVMSLTDPAPWANDPLRPWFSSIILTRLFQAEAGADAKQAILALTFGDTSQGEEPVPFMHSMAHAMSVAHNENMDVKAVVSILSLLCIWLYGSATSVSQFLSEGVNLQNLIEWCQAPGVDALVQGLSAYLLGIVYEYDEDEDTPFPRSNLHPILLGRIGSDMFASKIRRLRESKQFQQTPRSLQVFSEEEDKLDPFFDPNVVDFIKETSDVIQQAISVDPNVTRSRRQTFDHSDASEFVPTHEVNLLKGKLNTQEQEIATLRAKIQELESTPKKSDVAMAEVVPRADCIECARKESSIKELERQLAEVNEKHTTLEKEQEDLLVFLADQDQEMKRMRARLRALGEDIPESDAEEE